jgi:predicted PurR-regulated permease PerM
MPKFSANQLIIGTVTVAAVAAAFWLLWRFNGVILVLLAAIIISLALQPIVKFLEGRGVAPWVSLVAIAILFVLLLVVGVVLLLPLLADQIGPLTEVLGSMYSEFRMSMRASSSYIFRRIAAAMPALASIEELSLPGTTAEMDSEQLREMIREIFNGFLSVVVTFGLAFYWTLESRGIKYRFFFLVPSDKREEAKTIVSEIEEKIGRFLLGQGLLMLIVFSISLVAFTIIGLPYALPLAMIAGLFEVLPMLGPTLGAIPPLMVALTISPTVMLWTLIAAGLVQFIENQFLVPRVMEKTVGVNPLLVLLSLFALGSIFGFLGALIAIPLSAIIQLLAQHYIWGREPLQASSLKGRDRLTRLRYETLELVDDSRRLNRNQAEENREPEQDLIDQIEGLALDLDAFLAGRIRQS